MGKTKVTYGYGDIWKIAYPLMISLLMEQLIGMTDTAFMGRVGEVELGASAIGGIFYLVIFMMGFGFSIGAQIVIARRNGEQLYERIGNLFWQGMYFLMFLAVVMFALTRIAAPLLLPGVVSSEAVAGTAAGYINYRIFGLFFAFSAAMFRAFFVGTTHTRTLTLNSVVMVLSNVFFNWVLVFGKLGMPRMGIEGAAVGSVLAEAVSLCFFIVYTVRKVDWRKYRLGKVYGIDMPVQKDLLKVSFWTMIQNFVSLSTWFAFFVFVEHLGERALAVTNIVRSISSFPFMMASAFASTCSSVTSNLIGASREDEVIPTIWRHVKLAWMIVVPTAAVIAAFPSFFASLFTDMPQVVADAGASVRVMCSSLLLTVPGLILFQSVSGTGNTRMAFVLELCVLAVYVGYSSFITLGLKMDVAFCWSAEHLYQGLIMISCLIYIRSRRWVGKRV